MNIGVTILLIMAAIMFGLDFLIRRKKWKDNSKEEKISLLVNMFSVGPYMFLSALSLLWGIASDSPETVLGEKIYDATLTMGATYFIFAAAAVVLSLVFRKIGKTKTSIWINIIAFVYIIAVLTVNSLAGSFL